MFHKLCINYTGYDYSLIIKFSSEKKELRLFTNINYNHAVKFGFPNNLLGSDSYFYIDNDISNEYFHVFLKQCILLTSQYHLSSKHLYVILCL